MPRTRLSGCRVVRDPVLGRVDNPFLIVRIQHGGLDIRMSEHVLDLVERSPSLKGDGRCRMPEGVRGDPSDSLRVADPLIEESCLPQRGAHHILNDPDPDRPTAPREGRVLLA